MKNKTFNHKLKNALTGIRSAFQTENTFRIQLVIGVVILLGLPMIQPALVWWALIIVCITLVLAAELINTAMETLIDHLHPDIHPEMGKVKDIMAGMVLVLSIASVLIALIAFIATYKGI